MTFQDTLIKLKIHPSSYLAIARRRAETTGFYDPNELHFANDSKHKLVYGTKKFGANGYNDYILYQLLYSSRIADQKRSNYRKRAIDVMKKTNSHYSPASLSWNILW